MTAYQSHGGVHRFSTARKVYAERNMLLRMIKRLLVAFSVKDKVRHCIESAPFRLNPRPKIIAISRMVREDMASFYHIDKEEIELIYNGIDTAKHNIRVREPLRRSIRQCLGIKKNDIAFLFISYDLKKKGVMPLIEASAQLRKSNVTNFKVLVVGEHAKHPVLRKVSKLDLEDTMFFLGPTTTPEEYYANCDVLVLPTFYDACSLVVLEAMSCGLPAVTTVYNGAAGIITNGRDGYVISHPPVAIELAEVMKALMSQNRLKEMSRQASLTGIRYSLEKNHQEMMMVFSKLAVQEHVIN